MKRWFKILLVLSAMTVLTVVLCASASAAEISSGTKSEIDITNRNDGYIKARMTSETEKRIKVKTSYTKSDGTKAEYTYDLNGKCEWETFSLQSGDGRYTVQVLENVDGTRYTVIQTATVDVKYSKANAPFLIPIQNVNYNSESAAVKKASELCAGTETELAQVEAIYKYIVETVKYDNSKARKVASGEITQYLPVVDNTLSTSKGICFDYSSLFAAMLRSQGIPTKLTMGYVPNGSSTVYHAWNEVYITDVGWIEIRSSVSFDGESWERMDSTFAAGNSSGKNTEYMNTDSNYKKNKEY